MPTKLNRTIILNNKPSIVGYGAVVGKHEKDGPLGKFFDTFDLDCRFGEESYEKAESRLQKIAVQSALKKANLCERDIDLIFAGDLLNQCIGSSFGLRAMEIPYTGIYGACSTMTLGLCLASVFVDSKAIKRAVAVTSSHFCSAERQYRFPLEYGSFRTQTAQRTVTGAGADIIEIAENKPYISKVCFGKMVDLGVKDANNMGAAMAPSAADTILTFLKDTQTDTCDYDAVFTGDLGYVGSELLYEILEKQGINIKPVHYDCGILIYDKNRQDVHSGGSGCGCSASVLNSYVISKLNEKIYRNILFVSTGALLSPTSVMQGESIPGVSHLVNIVSD